MITGAEGCRLAFGDARVVAQATGGVLEPEHPISGTG